VKDKEVENGQEPVVTRRGDRHDDSVETHPAYGQIGASRVSAGGKGVALYGSDFRHHHFVVVTIHESELHRSLGRDWPHAHRELIRVALSEAQWARFVSAMNTGDMAQCTVERVAGEGARPDIVAPKERHAQFKRELLEDMDDALRRIDALRARVEDGKLPAKERQHVLDELHMIKMRIADGVPHTAKSFDEHVEKTTEKARIEINAHLTATVQRAGLDALGARPPFELPEQAK